MKRWFTILFLVTALATSAHALTLSGTVTGGQGGITLKTVLAVPTTLDTVFITIAIPIINSYTFPGLPEGGYVLFAYQDLNTNLLPDLDEPRGFYGGEVPQIFDLISDSGGVVIELQEPNQGGFTGTISYSGTNTGTTLIFAHYSADFAGLPHGGSLLLNATGNGTYTALVDSFTTYYVYAFMDLNTDFTWEVGEPYGVYGGETPQAIEVEPTDFPENVDITLEETSAAEMPTTPAVRDFALTSVYPNPFNRSANITFTVAIPADLELGLYDVLGRKVMNLGSGSFPAGEHRVGLSGADLSTGVYYIRLSGAGETQSRTVLLLK